MGFSNDVRITSLDVARALGFREERKSGGNWRNFCCPFCGDTKFRLGCNIEKGGYKCFHCGAKGTPLSLYARATQGISVESLNDEKTHELIKEMTARCVNGSVPTETEKQRYQHKEIPVAPSSVLDRTYSTLLSLPWLKLTKEHRANLKKRGLTDADIQRNGYASFTVKVSEQMAVSAKNASKRFNAIKGELFSYSRMKQKTSASVIAGMVIASALLKRGCELQGVPGFYKVQNTWILNLPEGMLIPTRNSGGQVVGIQVRRDGDANPRYLTVSANRLPCGVTTGISRAHFPLGNAPLTKGTTVYLTEGPLKADVALALLEDKNAAFIAIQGVTNTKMLDEVVFPSLKERGITRVTNALDMDKLTNPGVIMACSALKHLAKNTVSAWRCFVGMLNMQRRRNRNWRLFASSMDWVFLLSRMSLSELGQWLWLCTKKAFGTALASSLTGKRRKHTGTMPKRGLTTIFWAREREKPRWARRRRRERKLPSPAFPAA